MGHRKAIKFIMHLTRSSIGCFALTINFLFATIFIWLAPIGDSTEMFLARSTLTGMFIPLGLTFCIMGFKRLREKD